MRNKSGFLLALFFLFLMATASAVGETTYAVVLNPVPEERLNLRQGPSLQTASLGKYYSGTYVKVNEVRADGWASVVIGEGKGSAEGYMDQRYLVFDSVDMPVMHANPILTISNPYALNAYLGSKPGNDADLVTCLPNGTAAIILGYTEDFYHVQVGGRVGYLAKAVSGNELEGQNRERAPGSLYSDVTSMPMDCGYMQVGTLTQVSEDWYCASVTLDTKGIPMNSVIIGYNLYLNGSPICYVQEQNGYLSGLSDNVPTYFEASFRFNGKIENGELRPVWRNSTVQNEPDYEDGENCIPFSN